MLWLKAWLQETALKGPRCHDGGLVREMRLSKQECLQTTQVNDPVATGCEAELLTAPGLGGFTPYMNLKDANTTKNKDLPPLPQESDYFYDEYIDYPYNETAVKEKEQLALKAINETTKKPTTIQHGNTPTIYAAPKTNATKVATNSPSSSGFTFFGVPLPSLNALLGATTTARKNDVATAQRKMAIVQPVTSTSTNRVFPPTVPEIQTGGFVPIVPNAVGGFKPMTMAGDLNLNRTNNAMPNENVVTKTESFVNNQSQPFDGSTKRQYDVNSTKTETIYEIRASDTVETVTKKADLVGSTTQNVVLPQKNNTSETSSSKLEIHNFTETEKFEDFFKETIDLPYSTTSSYERGVLIDEIIEENFNSPAEKTTERPESLSNELQKRENNTATPLTTLLIPSGEQSFKHPPPGRSTITKVLSPHAPLSSSLKVTDVGVSALLQKDDIITEASTVLDKDKQDTSWYFTNYNKTNVEPYVGQSNFYKSNAFDFRSSVEFKFLLIVIGICLLGFY